VETPRPKSQNKKNKTEHKSLLSGPWKGRKKKGRSALRQKAGPNCKVKTGAAARERRGFLEKTSKPERKVGKRKTLVPCPPEERGKNEGGKDVGDALKADVL